MAATKRNASHIQSVRDKIRTTQLINRLQDHALGGCEMTKTQVSAAVALIRKTVPDLSVQQLTGEDGGPVQIQQVERRIVDPKH